jgi:diacylglycerol kinase family enzyme
VHVDVEDGPQLSNVRFAIVSKATPYTHLGRLPLNIARNANIDSRLSLTAFTRLRAMTLVGGAASSIRSGKFLASRKDVVALDDLTQIHVYAETPFPYQVDGDDAGDTSELRITFAPDALAIALPPT